MVTTTKSRAMALGSRAPLVLIGGACLWMQVQLVSQYFGADTTFLYVPPLVSVALALIPIWIDAARRERHWATCVGFCILFVIGIVFSASNMLGRVSEHHAGKNGDATKIARQYADAKGVADRADVALATATKAVGDFCGSTVASETREKKKRTTTKVLDPRCVPAQTQLAAATVAATAAHNSLSSVPIVPEIDADIKETAATLRIDPETWGRTKPLLLPAFLELAMVLCFLFAFRPLSYSVQEVSEAEPREVRGNVVNFEAPALVMTQQVVNALVAKWIAEEGFPEDRPIGQACGDFNAWLKRKHLVNVKSFGKAITDLGIPKRVKRGRVLIARA